MWQAKLPACQWQDSAGAWCLTGAAGWQRRFEIACSSDALILFSHADLAVVSEP